MKVKLNRVRLSFPDLFEAVQFEGAGPFSYKAQFLIEPGSANDKAVKAAIQAEAESAFKAKSKAILDSIKGNSMKFCYIDGNTKSYDGYEDMWALSTSRSQDKGRPLTLGKDASAVTAEDGVLYAGCYVNASVDVWAQDNKWGKAVRCTLLGVQFHSDGDSFAAGAKPDANDFDSIDEGATADDLA